MLAIPTAWLIPIAALLLAGLAAGFAGGVFGIGGGFVVVPALLVTLPLLGGDKAHYAHVAIGTSAATIVFTSIRSVLAHHRRGSVDFGILRAWAPWIVVGDVAGVLLADHVDGRALTLVFATGVLLMSLAFLLPRLDDKVLRADMPDGAARIGIAGGLGAFSSLLGIGGGTIAIMVMTMCGRSIHRAVATASGVGTLIAIPSAVGFAIIGLRDQGLPLGSLGFVNLPAMLAIVSTSVLAAPLGVAAAHALEPRRLRRIFGVYLVVIAIAMFRNAAAM